MQRTENTITTLTQRVSDQGGRYIARIDGGAVTVDVQNVETYASLRLPLEMLEGFIVFLQDVKADPAAAVAESSEPVTEPDTQEEATNG